MLPEDNSSSISFVTPFAPIELSTAVHVPYSQSQFLSCVMSIPPLRWPILLLFLFLFVVHFSHMSTYKFFSPCCCRYTLSCVIIHSVDVWKAKKRDQPRLPDTGGWSFAILTAPDDRKNYLPLNPVRRASNGSCVCRVGQDIRALSCSTMNWIFILFFISIRPPQRSKGTIKMLISWRDSRHDGGGQIDMHTFRADDHESRGVYLHPPVGFEPPKKKGKPPSIRASLSPDFNLPLPPFIPHLPSKPSRGETRSRERSPSGCCG